MLSRVAENLYWISRYVERADNVVRLVADAFQMELEIGKSWKQGPRPLEQVVSIIGAGSLQLADESGIVSVEKIEATLSEFTFNRENESSVLMMLARARENARGVQEALSTEAWSQINQIYLFLSSPQATDRFNSGAFRYFQRLKKDCTLFSAIIDTTLPRDEAYHFLILGRYLERVDMLSRIVGVLSTGLRDENPNLLAWTNLLRSYSAYEAYMRHTGERIDAKGVIRYLLLEEDFPRSMRYALARCLRSMRAVAKSSDGYSTAAERHLGRLESDLRYIDIQEVLARGIDQFLENVRSTTASVGGEIHQAYFRT
jgi:uncharacterized alpha-E superfamily protein